MVGFFLHHRDKREAVRELKTYRERLGVDAILDH